MKSSRHEMILQLISEYEISTQEELTSRLNEMGCKTTQATVSRDIKALQLRKVPALSGQKYTGPEAGVIERDKYLRVFSSGLVRMEPACNLVIIKTFAGMAMAVAAALDELKMPEIVGSIAGDDTIMCACHSEKESLDLISNIETLLKDIK